MSDANPPTPDPAPAGDPEAHHSHNVINQELLEDIARARTVAAAAADPANAPALAAEDLAADIATRINTLANETVTDIAALLGTRAGRKVLTKGERAARDHLLAVIQPIQAAARRAFGHDPARLHDGYFVGHNLASRSLHEVTTAARGIHARLTPAAAGGTAEDTLPGITPAGRIKELASAIADYGALNDQQSEKLTESEAGLEAITAKVAKLTALRREVQLAADQAWNWRKPGVETIRKSFLLPLGHPLN